MRVTAISTVAFDGHPIEIALGTIAALGATHVEPAYIAGTMVFSEDDLSERAAVHLRRAITAAGLGCVAVSAHMDSGVADADARLARRLRFAAGLGAAFVITNTARADRRDAFLRAATSALRVAEACGVALAFENPGHGPDDLLRVGANAAALLAELSSPWATLNYDVGNAFTNSEGRVCPENDLRACLSVARHLHLKDMSLRDCAWHYTALGEGGMLDYVEILDQVATRPDVPVCIELPTRQIRLAGQPPARAQHARPLISVRDMLARSMRRLGQDASA